MEHIDRYNEAVEILEQQGATVTQPAAYLAGQQMHRITWTDGRVTDTTAQGVIEEAYR